MSLTTGATYSIRFNVASGASAAAKDAILSTVTETLDLPQNVFEAQPAPPRDEADTADNDQPAMGPAELVQNEAGDADDARAPDATPDAEPGNAPTPAENAEIQEELDAAVTAVHDIHDLDEARLRALESISRVGGDEAQALDGRLHNPFATGEGGDKGGPKGQKRRDEKTFRQIAQQAVFDAIDAQIAQIDAQLAALDAEESALLARRGELVADLAEIDANIERLEGELAEIDAQITDLEARMVRTEDGGIDWAHYADEAGIEVERREGESDADYQARVQGTLEDQMLDENGNVKPEYANSYAANLLELRNRRDRTQAEIEAENRRRDEVTTEIGGIDARLGEIQLERTRLEDERRRLTEMRQNWERIQTIEDPAQREAAIAAFMDDAPQEIVEAYESGNGAEAAFDDQEAAMAAEEAELDEAEAAVVNETEDAAQHEARDLAEDIQASAETAVAGSAAEPDAPVDEVEVEPESVLTAGEFAPTDAAPESGGIVLASYDDVPAVSPGGTALASISPSEFADAESAEPADFEAAPTGISLAMFEDVPGGPAAADAVLAGDSIAGLARVNAEDVEPADLTESVDAANAVETEHADAAPADGSARPAAQPVELRIG